MDRTQALAPLNTGEGRFTLTAGALLRGIVRKASIKAGVDYYEEKGFLESVFVIRGSSDRIITLHNFLKKTLD